MPLLATIRGILAPEMTEQREEILERLTKAYWMEIETVMSYIAASTNPDGVRAREVAASLGTEVQEELTHAKRFAQRIKELHGTVPGSMDFQPDQGGMQPPASPTDITHVIRGVIDAETAAINHYQAIIELTDGIDPVTQDMVTDILADEEGHRRRFEGYLREYTEQEDQTNRR